MSNNYFANDFDNQIISLIFKTILPLLILTISLLTGILSLSVFLRFKKSNQRDLFCIQIVFQILTILNIIPYWIEDNYGFSISTISAFICVFCRFEEINSPTIVAWIMAYISVERVLQISFSRHRAWKRRGFRFTVAFTIIVISSMINSKIAFNFNILSRNDLQNGKLDVFINFNYKEYSRTSVISCTNYGIFQLYHITGIHISGHLGYNSCRIFYLYH